MAVSTAVSGGFGGFIVDVNCFWTLEQFWAAGYGDHPVASALALRPHSPRTTGTDRMPAGRCLREALGYACRRAGGFETAHLSFVAEREKNGV